jgi:dihydroorotase
MTDGLRITRPDDWHVHFRDGESLRYVVPDTARRFARAIVMPNLDPPVTRVAQALDYRRRILACIPETVDFTPLMTLYLTDETTAEEVSRARDCEHVYGIKLYPAGATTNSAFGVTDMQRVSSALAAMENAGVPLLVHGEVSDPQIDVFDRERVFIERVLAGLVESFPGLKVVFEHVTTCEAVAFVSEAPENVAATITAHHLRANPPLLPAGFETGNPSPGAHRRRHRWQPEILSRHRFRAPCQIGKGDRLRLRRGVHRPRGDRALCGNLRRRGRARRSRRVRERSPWKVPESLAFGDDVLVPFRAGEQLSWSLANQ